MIPHTLASIFILALALVPMGCTLYAQPLDPTFSVSAGYTPLRYQGYVVYYDRGLPYYVMDGRRYQVPPDSRHYHRYRRHYRLYHDRPAYREWRTRQAPVRGTRQAPVRGPRRDYRTRGPRYRDPQLRHRPR